MTRSEFLDRAILLFCASTTDREAAIKRAVELLEMRDAAHAVVCPDQVFDCNLLQPAAEYQPLPDTEPDPGDSQELGGASARPVSLPDPSDEI